MPDPATLYLDAKAPLVFDRSFAATPYFWRYLSDLQQGITIIDLASQVTGILPVVHGGTGKSNLTFTTSGATNVTLPTSGTIVATTSPITAVNLTATTGVTPDSGGIKHGRITTGVVVAGASAVVSMTWTTPFPDTNYTAIASVLDGTAAVASLSVVHIESITPAAVVVRVQNTSAGNLTGTLHVIGMHD